MFHAKNIFIILIRNEIIDLVQAPDILKRSLLIILLVNMVQFPAIRLYLMHKFLTRIHL